MSRLFVALACAVWLAGCHAADKRETQASGSLASPPLLKSHLDAKTIFSTKCSGCHGANGGGGMGPSLSQVAAKGDAFIRHRITQGSPENGMPAFGAQLSRAEIDALVRYVKTL